jgi:hypothetical protein
VADVSAPEGRELNGPITNGTRSVLGDDLDQGQATGASGGVRGLRLAPDEIHVDSAGDPTKTLAEKGVERFVRRGDHGVGPVDGVSAWARRISCAKAPGAARCAWWPAPGIVTISRVRTSCCRWRVTAGITRSSLVP